MADDGLSRLTDDEKTALVALLKRTIDDDRYPLSPRIRTLRGILAKLEPPRPAPAPLTAGAMSHRREGGTGGGGMAESMSEPAKSSKIGSRWVTGESSTKMTRQRSPTLDHPQRLAALPRPAHAWSYGAELVAIGSSPIQRQWLSVTALTSLFATGTSGLSARSAAGGRSTSC